MLRSMGKNFWGLRVCFFMGQKVASKKLSQISLFHPALNIGLKNINLDDSNNDNDDPETILHIKLLAWHIKFEKLKSLKKKISEELMLVVWHPHRWWNQCKSDDEEKEIDPMLIKEF